VLITSSPTFAKCAKTDLAGRWDVYGFTDRFALLAPDDPDFVDATGLASTDECAVSVNNNGRFAKARCVARTPFGPERFRGEGDIEIAKTCVVSGQINLGAFTANGGCEIRGTLTRSKDAILGIAYCAVPQPNDSFPGDFLTTFSMVRH
jgi:hypothetical protein